MKQGKPKEPQAKPHVPPDEAMAEQIEQKFKVGEFDADAERAKLPRIGGPAPGDAVDAKK